MPNTIVIQDEHQSDLFLIGQDSSTQLNEQSLQELSEITTKYRESLTQHHSIAAKSEDWLQLGRDLCDWLKGRGWTGDLLSSKSATFGLRFRVDFSEPGTPGAIVANAPFELLADEKGFLARRRNSKFVVLRRFLNGEGDYETSDFRLSQIYMAASPLGQTELDYREEEVAISESAGRHGIDLIVEETGQLEELANLVTFVNKKYSHTDVLHLTCHGTNKPQPMLALESETGELNRVAADELWNEIDHGKFKLGFISACHTAESAGTAPSFARQLVADGLPNAVAWDGAVTDNEAILFAENLYKSLNRGKSVLSSYLAARNSLAADSESRDWHLCRLLLSENAGQPLCKGIKSQQNSATNQAETAFLD